MCTKFMKLKHTYSLVRPHNSSPELLNLFGWNFVFRVLFLALAPQPSLGLDLLHKIRLNFLEASQQFSFYRVGLLAPRQTLIPEDDASALISPQRQGGYPF
jgi:hypothetical protein